MGSRSKYRARLSSHTARLDTETSPAAIKVEASEEGKQPGPATFSGIAYSGGLVPGSTATPRLPHPFVVDLAGTKKARSVKANLDHKHDKRVGHVPTVTNDGQQLAIEGVLSAATPHRDEVLDSHRGGFDWEFSAEFSMDGKQFIPKGQSAVVNGRTLNGPFYRFTNNQFTDVAFVDHGADHGNAARVAASAAGVPTMNEFEKFVTACGHDPATISDEVRATLQEAFDAKTKLAQNGTANGTQFKSFEDTVAENRARVERHNRISMMANDAMRQYPLHIDKIAALAKMAMESDTDPDKFELELLRGTRATTGQFSNIRSTENDPRLVECALAMAVGLPEIEKHYDQDTLNMVDRAHMRRFSLQSFLMQVASSNGYVCRAGERIDSGNIREVLEYCFPPVHARMSGFSTISVSGIVGAVANKEILAGYMEEEQNWREIATIRPVSNFHTHTAYRLLDSLEYEQIGPTGQIPHGTLGQESYTRQAKTYAKMLGITREDIINDDLGAFDDLRARLGRGAAKKFNNVFWAAFMDNSSFFTSGNTNYISGSTTNLGSDGVGLQLGITAYRKMTTPAADGSKRMGVSAGRPSLLLVPPELEFNARTLYTSTNWVTGASGTLGSNNIFQNLYRPVIENRLSDSAFTGYSTTAWYLFGMELKPMVVSFLNGQQTPTVESADADFNQLGIQFRGYHDFGCDKAEYLAGIKSKGAS